MSAGNWIASAGSLLQYHNARTTDDVQAHFPGEFDGNQGDFGELFGGLIMIAGDQRFLLPSRVAQQESPAMRDFPFCGTS